MRRKKPTRESNNRLNRSEDKDDDGSINNSIIIKSQLPSKDTTSAYGTFSDTNKDHDLDTVSTIYMYTKTFIKGPFL